MPEETKELSLRIERIEKLVEGLAGQRQAQPADLSADEIKAYQKVRDVIAVDYGRFCGINDCFRCVIVRCLTACQTVCDIVCEPCDIECSCGPCAVGGLRGRTSRFGRLG